MQEKGNEKIITISSNSLRVPHSQEKTGILLNGTKINLIEIKLIRNIVE